jgi:hypothetical protein
MNAIAEKFSELTNTTADERERISKILSLEQALLAIPGVTIGNSPHAPLKHHFAPGVYIREIFIPKGTVLTGRIHLHEHFCILVSGHVICADEIGTVELQGFNLFTSRPRTKRAITVLEDCVFLTVHPREDDETDVETLEARYVVNTYEEYEQKLIEAERPKLRLCEVVP